MCKDIALTARIAVLEPGATQHTLLLQDSEAKRGKGGKYQRVDVVTSKIDTSYKKSFDKNEQKAAPDSHVIEALAHGNTPRSSPNNNDMESWRWPGRKSFEEEDKPAKSQNCSGNQPQIHGLEISCKN